MTHDRWPVEILLVEDNPGDARLTLEALADGKIRNRIHVVADGDAALRFLRREDGHADRPRTDLVLLDLNLPGKDGIEVLTELKADPDLSTIPVVVLTSSDAETDVVRAYANHANSYVTKPVGLDDFLAVVRSIHDFWVEVVKLPGAPRGVAG